MERLRRRPQRTHGGEGLRAGLVGREGEMRKLRAALAELWRGQGGVVWLTGDAGVGKSRLVEELAELTSDTRRSLWLEGRCLEMIQAAAYAPFVGLLQAHLTAAAEPAGAALGVQLRHGWMTSRRKDG